MAKPAQKSNFWNYLLLGAFGVTAAIAILLIAGALIVPRAVNRVIESYTDTAPQPGPAVAVSEDDYDALRDRVDAFADAVDAGLPHEPLVLTSEEVAALVQRELEKEFSRGGASPPLQAWMRVENGKLRGPISILMDDAAVGMLSHLRGRYLNGVATFDLRHENGRFRVGLDAFEIDGDPIPNWMRTALQDQIDAAVAESKELQDAAAKLGGVELAGDRAVVRALHTETRTRVD